jgi:small GTP-binding protein
MNLYDFRKIIVLGDPIVGKNELLSKLRALKSDEKSIVTPFKLKNVSILKESIELKEFNVTVDLEFWDIAKHPINRSFFKGANGLLLVFDITSSSTFENIKTWYRSAAEYDLSDIPIILIGNNAHSGNERKINRPTAERLCEELNIYYYFETSPLTGYNVLEIFEKIAELIYRTKVLNQPVRNQKVIVKEYRGEIINTPLYEVIDAHWLDALDNRKFSIPFPAYPRYLEIKRLKAKRLTEEEKRERKARALLYFKNERRKTEEWEKREKLIKVMKKSDELKKEKSFLIIPSAAISKTKEDSENYKKKD